MRTGLHIVRSKVGEDKEEIVRKVGNDEGRHENLEELAKLFEANGDFAKAEYVRDYVKRDKAGEAVPLKLDITALVQAGLIRVGKDH